MILQIFGQINSPYTGDYNRGNTDFGGITIFIRNTLKLFFVVAGLLLFFNLVIAGFQFLNAGGDPKAIEQAWNKIWQSLVGLLIVVTSFIISAIVGFLFFGDASFFTYPFIYGPN